MTRDPNSFDPGFRPSTPPGKISDADLRRLIEAGSAVDAAAAFFRVSTAAVVRACGRLGIDLAPREIGSAGVKIDPPAPIAPKAPRSRPAPAQRAGEGLVDPAGLIATGGRHSDLSSWAAANGITTTQARIAWFKLRRPVEPRKGL